MLFKQGCEAAIRKRGACLVRTYISKSRRLDQPSEPWPCQTALQMGCWGVQMRTLRAVPDPTRLQQRLCARSGNAAALVAGDYNGGGTTATTHAGTHPSSPETRSSAHRSRCLLMSTAPTSNRSRRISLLGLSISTSPPGDDGGDTHRSGCALKSGADGARGSTALRPLKTQHHPHVQQHPGQQHSVRGFGGCAHRSTS